MPDPRSPCHIPVGTAATTYPGSFTEQGREKGLGRRRKYSKVGRGGRSGWEELGAGVAERRREGEGRPGRRRKKCGERRRRQ